MPPSSESPRVIAVLGKGGAGKTVLSALLARALLDAQVRPLLLVDGDPATGLGWALGAPAQTSLAQVQERILSAAGEEAADTTGLAASVDYHLLSAMEERPDFSLLAVGASEREGCFCPVHRLLRLALEQLSRGFRMVLVDAEAGVEPLHRQIVDRLELALVVSDGSLRGARTAERVSGLVRRFYPDARVGFVLSRAAQDGALPAGAELWARLPEDPEVAKRDRSGTSLLDLPAESPALRFVTGMCADRILR